MMTRAADDSHEELEHRPNRFPDLALLAGLAGAIFLAATGLITPGMAAWETNLLQISGALTIASTLLGMVWIMRGREALGATVAISMVFIHVILLSLTIHGLGLILILAPVPLTWAFTSKVAGEKLQNRFMYSAVGVGTTALLIDIFTSSVGARNALPDSYWPVMVGFIILLAFFNGYYFVRQFDKYTLRTKLVFSFVLVTIVSLGLLGVLNERSTRAALTNDAQDSLLAAAQQSQDSIISFINNAMATIENEATLPIFQDYLNLAASERAGSSERLSVQETLEALLGKDPEFISSYALLDSTGTVVADTDRGEIRKNKSDRDYFQQVIDSGQPYLSNMVISETTNEGSLYISSPVLSSGQNSGSSDQVLGVLRVRYDSDILQSLLETSNGLVGVDSFGVLFDENFIHLAHGIAPETIFTTVTPLDDSVLEELVAERRLPDLPKAEIFHDLPELEKYLNETASSEDGIVFFETVDVATGERQLEAVAIQFEWFQDWMLVFFQPQDIFLAPAESQTRQTVLLSLAIAAVVVVVGFWLAQILANPIVDLTNVAERVSGGDFAARSEISGEDEIGRLAEAFNDMTTQLRVLVMSLEDQVAARTKDLELQTKNQQISAEIARDATAESNIDNMLERAVNLTRSRFNFHYVGIYLLDTHGETAYLRAATGEAGANWIANQKRFNAADEDAIGQVLRQGEAKIETSPSGEEGSMLPEATSQLVIPLKVGGEVMGVMDIQSSSPDDFVESQLGLFQTMGDQLAIAIQRTELRDEMEQALKELETAYGRFTRSEWQEFLFGSRKAKGYLFNQQSLQEIAEAGDDIRRVWEVGETVELEPADGKPGKLAVPLKIRGEVIGVLSLGFDETTSLEESRELIEEIAKRLALVMENARLVEAAQMRVERQRLIGEVSDHIRGTLDLESILKTAAEKIRESLDLPEVSLRLVNPSMGNRGDGSNGNSEAV